MAPRGSYRYEPRTRKRRFLWVCLACSRSYSVLIAMPLRPFGPGAVPVLCAVRRCAVLLLCCAVVCAVLCCSRSVAVLCCGLWLCCAVRVVLLCCAVGCGCGLCCDCAVLWLCCAVLECCAVLCASNTLELPMPQTKQTP